MKIYFPSKFQHESGTPCPYNIPQLRTYIYIIQYISFQISTRVGDTVSLQYSTITDVQYSNNPTTTIIIHT